jgi:hypothetical protein
MIPTIAKMIGEPENPALEAARLKFSNHSAKIEQALAQRRPPSSIGLRRMEWEAVKAIIAAYEEAKNASR